MFIDENGVKLTTIELAQVPVYAPTFQLRRTIGYYEGMGEMPSEGEISWAREHVPSLDPEPGNRTDLASVPSLFWSLIASYGRQTAPAIVHDAECWSVRVGGFTPDEALARRERIDRRFRLGLRELAVPPFMAWLMWTFVSFERYQKHSIPRFIGMLLLGSLGLLLVVAAVVLALVGHPLGLLLALLPLATSAVGGRHWQLLLWASYAGALMVPVAAFSLLAYIPFFIVENVAWFFVDRPSGKGSPVVGTVDVKNLRRTVA